MNSNSDLENDTFWQKYYKKNCEKFVGVLKTFWRLKCVGNRKQSNKMKSTATSFQYPAVKDNTDPICVQTAKEKLTTKDISAVMLINLNICCGLILSPVLNIISVCLKRIQYSITIPPKQRKLKFKPIEPQHILL